MINKIRASPQRREKFARSCVMENLESKELIIDVATRWNSTYEMIVRARELREMSYQIIIYSYVFNI